MDIHLLIQVVDELSALLKGTRVERVYQGDEGAVYVVFHMKKDFVLLLSPDRSMPRLHLVTAKPAAAESPSGFVLYLRSRLAGARVASIGLLNEDRVVEFVFAGRDSEYRLVFELTGSTANLIFTDPSRKILAVFHPAALTGASVRPLMPGFAYAPPVGRRRLAGDRAAFESVEDVSANRAAENFYGRLINERRVVALRSSLSAVIRKSLSRIGRRIEALSADLDHAMKAEELRQAGELILANLSRVEKGVDRAVFTGYDGAPVTVQLDPRRSPAQNAEGYFKKYKKAKAGLDIIAARLREARDEHSHLSSLQSRLEHAEERDDIGLIRSELVGRGYLRDGGRKTKPASAALPFRRLGYRGWEILVGKNAAGNDYITMRLARPDDLWLHAEGMAGSHVLIRNPKGADVPPDVIVKAASLAAYFSKGRGAGKVPVAYTLAKFVRKPRGAKPGAVTLTERRTLMVAPGEITPSGLDVS